MSAKKQTRQKHVPQRTCVGCRETLAKRAMTRIVRSPEGIKVDLTGKLPGRGAYLHNHRSCWERGINGALARALKTDLTTAEVAYLQLFLAALPEEDEEPVTQAHQSKANVESDPM